MYVCAFYIWWKQEKEVHYKEVKMQVEQTDLKYCIGYIKI